MSDGSAAPNLFFDVFVSDNEFLHPQTENVLCCKIDYLGEPKGEDIVFSPMKDKLESRGLFGANVLARNVNNRIYIRVMNPTNETVELMKDTKIGTIEKVEQQHVDLGTIRNVNDSKEEQDANEDLFSKITINDSLTSNQRKQLIELLTEYRDIFSKSKTDIGHCSLVKHEIFCPDVSPIHLPTRRVPMGMEDKVDALVDDLLQQNIIRPSMSPWNAPIVVIKKKSGDIRLCIDYRMLNSVTKKTSFPIPETQQLLDSLAGSSFFSGIDLSSAYYQLEINEEHKEVTAFGTRKGHYEFNRMPFGLCGAPFTFQRMMNLLLQSENWSQCLIYLDDVMIFSPTFEKHLDRLRNIFEKIRESGIKLGPEKCSFVARQLTFLGHVVSEKGIETDPRKIEALKTWKKPESSKLLRQFLGFANYYRKFIKGYAELAAPLEDLLKEGVNGGKVKDYSISWSTDADIAFDELIKALTSAPVLSYPIPGQRFIIDCDASFGSIGAVLSQVQNGQERVISYASKKLSKAERQYCVTRKELFAVYHFVKNFRHYLLGNRFLLRTDHKALIWMLNWKKPSTSQYCNWVAELASYDFEIVHRPGEQHINADFMSRIEKCGQCELIHADPKRKRNVKILNASSIKMIAKPRNTDSIEEKWRIVKQYHDGMGHIGADKVIDVMKRSYNWPHMVQDVKNYVAGCIFCAERKVGKLKQDCDMHVTARRPFEKIMIDITGPLTPAVKGYRYILGIIDIYSRYPMLIPLKSTESDNIADVLFSNWIAIFGCPEVVISDGGSNFNSALMKKFFSKFHIRKVTSSPYHPQSNGTIERLFRTMKDMVYATAVEKHESWKSVLPQVEIGLRNTKHRITGFAPSEIVFGRLLNWPHMVRHEEIPIDRHQYIDHTNETRQQISNKMSQQSSTVVVAKPSRFNVGDFVMVRKIVANKAGISEPRFFGPCIVNKIIGLKTYELGYQGRQFQRNSDHLKSFRPRESQNLSSKFSTSVITSCHSVAHDTVHIDQRPRLINDRVNSPIGEHISGGIPTTARYPRRRTAVPKFYGFSDR